MRGIPEWNFLAFQPAAKWLREQGYTVFNPAEEDDPSQTLDDYERDPLGTARECFARDTQYICKHADAVALLPGWHNSKGADAECALALALGLKVFYLLKMPSGEWFLLEAEDLG